jgi:aspartate/methionine/tyrosine aminotransferase
MDNTKDLHNIAKELNKKIIKSNKNIYDMFSEEGIRMFMPKGVLSQTAEAKAKKVKYNATIGIATENNEPMYLSCINQYFKSITPVDTYPYAPSTGIKELREVWKDRLYEKNPSLKNKEISLPVSTIGITHSVTITSSLFINPDDTVLVPQKMWGNYNLILKERKKANLIPYNLFTDDMKLDIEGIKNTFIEKAKQNSKLLIILNFPNNPTGYTPTLDEANTIVNTIKSLPDYDCNIIVFFDDAYFGLFYEEDSYKQSMFAELANTSERILAIKGDGATKENYVWGFRIGFITFGSKTNNYNELYEALEKKASGVIRGTVSSPPKPLQQIILNSLKSQEFIPQKEQKSKLMMERYQEVKRVVNLEKYLSDWTPYPFNSGYFMCLKLKHNIDANELRLHLLNKYSLGIISTSKTDIRIAFSCLEKSSISDVFELIYSGIQDLKNK